MKANRIILNPIILVSSTWVGAVILAYLGPHNQVHRVHDLSTTFTTPGVLWIFVSIASFGIGATIFKKNPFIFRFSEKSIGRNPMEPYHQLTHSWLIMLMSGGITFIIIVVLAYWTAVAISEVGGPVSFYIQLTRDWQATGDMWVALKPFFGARLLYTLLISTTIISFYQNMKIRSLEEPYEVKQYKNIKYGYAAILSVSISVLGLLPILVSQRLLFATAVCSCGILYVLENGTSNIIKWGIPATVSGFFVWTIVEAIRTHPMPLIKELSFASSRILFYFTNDIGNLNRIAQYNGPRTGGYYTFEFVFVTLNTEGVAEQELAGEFLAVSSSYIGGGTPTALGAPLLDFGYGAVVLFVVSGIISYYVYYDSKFRASSAQVYSLIASGILLSWHFSFASTPIFWFNILFILGINYASRYVVSVCRAGAGNKL